jgi:glycosyltransferase involved in cell wall biosynthesis
VRGRLLFFGKVRRYKGVDVLLRALAQLDGVRLTVVGEIYPDAADVDTLVDRLGMRDRVDLHPGYLPAAGIPDLFASVDALVLPYRTATASQHVALAHRHGLPVVATRVGNFPDTIHDRVDGLLCTPGDAGDLARALHELYAPGRLEALRAAVGSTDGERVWKTYLETLLTPDDRARGRRADLGE